MDLLPPPAGFGSTPRNSLLVQNEDIPPKPMPRRKKITRRHTVGGPKEEKNQHHNAVAEAVKMFENKAASCQYRVDDIPVHSTPKERCNSLSKREADRKREVFLKYLQIKYPEHADVISGHSRSASANFGRNRSRSSYSSSETSELSALSPLSASHCDTANQPFTRGSRFRASLPIVQSERGRSSKTERIVFLQFNGETRTVRLPPELTGLDTIRALFVQAYHGLLTMPGLNSEENSIMLKNTKSGEFEEVDNVKRIKNRSFLRVRPRNGSGIPMPGSKKSPARSEKTNGVATKEKNTGKQIVANGNGKSKLGFGAKNNSKAVTNLRQNTKKEQNKIDTNNNKNSKSPTRGNEVNKNGVGKTQDVPTHLENGGVNSLHGNGVGGGSVPNTGFSYHHPPTVPGSMSCQNNINNNNSPQVGFNRARETSPIARGLKPPSANISTPNGSTNQAKKGIPAPKSKPSLLKPKTGKSQNINKDPVSSSSGNDSSNPEPEHLQMAQDVQRTGLKPPATTKPKPMVLNKPKSLLAPTNFYNKPPKKLSLLSPPSNQSNLTTRNNFKSGSKLNSEGPESGHPGNTNLKRPESPERKATINRVGAARTFRGKQGLIPVGIPKVPLSKSTNDIDGADASKTPDSKFSRIPPPTKPKPMTNSMNALPQERLEPPPSNQTLVNVEVYAHLPSGDLEDDNEDESTSFFGSTEVDIVQDKHKMVEDHNVLNKLISAQEMSHGNSLVNSAENLKPTQKSVNVLKYADQFENKNVSHTEHGLRSESPHLTKTAKIPTSNFVSNMIRKCSSENYNKPAEDSGKPESSLTPTNGVEVPVKSHDLPAKSSMVKLGSATSVVSSDSSGGSSVSSSRPGLQKKVSFQNDVMVREGYGESTYVERLKSKSTDDVTETGIMVGEQIGVEGDYNDFVNNRKRSEDGSRYPQEQNERKSAVAAAIETITGRPSGRTTPLNVGRPHTPVQSDKTSSSRNNIPHKENWYPKQRLEYKPAPNYSMYAPSPLMQTEENGRYSPAIMAVGPSPTLSYTHVTQMHQGLVSQSPMSPPYDYQQPIVLQDSLQADPSPYFQTQSGFPFNSSDKDGKPFKDGPYYDVKNYPLDGGVDKTDSHQKVLSSVSSSNSGMEKNFDEGKTVKTDDRVKVVEAKLESLTGIVESYITQTPHMPDKSPPREEKKKDEKPPKPSNLQEKSFSSSPSKEDSKLNRIKETSSNINISDEVKRQMISLKHAAKEMKIYLEEIKRQQRKDMEELSELFKSRTEELSSFISATAGAEHRPIRARRISLDNKRHAYQADAATTERQLTDVEAAVEELRNEVVDRRCRVNAKEVETLALQLSHAGRTIANLKSCFPKLCEELRSVGSAETEVVIQEEKFIDTEPSRLDEQLKRCKQITATLFTLKKLANVQEARSKTPVPMQNIPGGIPRPETPSLYLASLSHSLHSQTANAQAAKPTDIKKSVMEEIRKQRVDNPRRMQSLQEAELRWKRRLKFVREYDSKKMEKALELAEKALRRTNNAVEVEEKRKKQLVTLYSSNNKGKKIVKDERKNRGNTTAPLSASSSLESLPSPPPPRMGSLHPTGSSQHHQSESIGSTALSPPSSITYASSTSSIATNPASENLHPNDHDNYSRQRHHDLQNHPQAPKNVNMGYYDRSDGQQNYVYRSNSLQRPRGRGQQLQQHNEYQKQRSRTPNPTMNYENYPQAMQMHNYSHQNNAYYAHPQYGNYNNNGGYNMSPGFDPYANYHPNQRSNMTTPNHFEHHSGHHGNTREIGRSQSYKTPPGGQLRKPTQYMNSPTPHQQQQHPQFNEGHRYDEQRQHKLQHTQSEKSVHLKEQYNKLQQMQRKQRSESSRMRKKIPPSQRKPPSRSQTPTIINTAAKSSDV